MEAKYGLGDSIKKRLRSIEINFSEQSGIHKNNEEIFQS